MKLSRVSRKRLAVPSAAAAAGFNARRCCSSTVVDSQKQVLQRTLLHDWHQDRGGKMVDFAGFSMPVEYNGPDQLSILESTKHTRTHASLFDVSHMGQLTFRGNDRVSFLEHICVGSVKPLKSMQCRYSLMLNHHGGTIDDLIFMNRTIDDTHYMVINAGRIREDLEHIDQEMAACKSEFGWDVSYEMPGDRQLMALQGPRAVEALARHAPSDFDFNQLKFFYSSMILIDGNIECQVSRTGYTGEDGFEIAVPNEHAVRFAELLVDGSDGIVQLAGLGARDALRLEAGLCLYGHELDESTTPVEADLLWTMSKKRKEEGRFVGNEVVKEQIAKGTTRVRVGMLGEKGPSPRAGMKVKSADGAQLAGEVTSGAFSPCLQRPIAMGYVRPEYAQNGTEIRVEIRPKKEISVTVCELPFVPKGYFK